MSALTYYRVANGIAMPTNPADTITDGTDSVLVLARDGAHALEIATEYDAGRVGHDNAQFGDTTTAVVRGRPIDGSAWEPEP